MLVSRQSDLSNIFFHRALKAAEIGLEAFAAEFKKEDANANVSQFTKADGTHFGVPLIHALIDTIPDDKLPAYLAILVQHKVDLKAKNLLGAAPLANAAWNLKKLAVDFLITCDAEMNEPTMPALGCVPRAIETAENGVKVLAIIKTLLLHGANVNSQDYLGYSSLMYAVKNCFSLTISELITQGASLFAKNDLGETALGIAYEEYLTSRRFLGEKNTLTLNKVECYKLLITAALDNLYRLGASYAGTEKLDVYLATYVKALAGKHVDSILPEKFLDTEILQPVLLRIRNEREQYHAFLMGSKLSRAQRLTNNSSSPVHKFFQKTTLRLPQYIFSYLHVTRNAAEHKKIKDAMLLDSGRHVKVMPNISSSTNAVRRVHHFSVGIFPGLVKASQSSSALNLESKKVIQYTALPNSYVEINRDEMCKLFKTILSDETCQLFSISTKWHILKFSNISPDMQRKYNKILNDCGLKSACIENCEIEITSNTYPEMANKIKNYKSTKNDAKSTYTRKPEKGWYDLDLSNHSSQIQFQFNSGAFLQSLLVNRLSDGNYEIILHKPKIPKDLTSCLADLKCEFDGAEIIHNSYLSKVSPEKLRGILIALKNSDYIPESLFTNVMQVMDELNSNKLQRRFGC